MAALLEAGAEQVSQPVYVVPACQRRQPEAAVRHKQGTRGIVGQAGGEQFSSRVGRQAVMSDALDDVVELESDQLMRQGEEARFGRLRRVDCHCPARRIERPDQRAIRCPWDHADTECIPKSRFQRLPERLVADEVVRDPFCFAIQGIDIVVRRGEPVADFFPRQTPGFAHTCLIAVVPKRELILRPRICNAQGLPSGVRAAAAAWRPGGSCPVRPWPRAPTDRRQHRSRPRVAPDRPRGRGSPNPPESAAPAPAGRGS
ncbi:unnamed protein product [Rhizophagus irregularis]|uniref:Uncharacterized protein n=1 Tax=Rhizophagus irregularis TaxID=588596 RepID=A0A915ZX44_9GLOM|nr:unnamed protein product [Rhizophagus irregularis]